ncbi:MAG: hypothetical protein OXC53_00990 [Rhodobacteraceae bacterium]|nr:hypothetical protein [Paracoccaceae bacterium]
MIILRLEKSPGGVEIPAGREKTDLIAGPAPRAGPINERLRGAEEPLAFTVIETRRAIKMILFVARQDTHSGHAGFQGPEI